MPIGDFLATFRGYEHIPKHFEKIMEATRETVVCKFALRALDQEDVTNEYYGFRKDENKKRLGKLASDTKRPVSS